MALPLRVDRSMLPSTLTHMPRDSSDRAALWPSIFGAKPSVSKAMPPT